MMLFFPTDYTVKGNHIIHHSNKDTLEGERDAINNHARMTRSRTVPGKLVCVAPHVVSWGCRLLTKLFLLVSEIHDTITYGGGGGRRWEGREAARAFRSRFSRLEMVNNSFFLKISIQNDKM